MIQFILNLPYTVIGIFVALISGITNSRFSKTQYSFIFQVKSFWWQFGYLKFARAMTIGHVILLGPRTLEKDLEHELIHVEQYIRQPFVYPFFYYKELFTKGVRNNKYEEEAYRVAKNVYVSKY